MKKFLSFFICFSLLVVLNYNTSQASIVPDPVVVISAGHGELIWIHTHTLDIGYHEVTTRGVWNGSSFSDVSDSNVFTKSQEYLDYYVALKDLYTSQRTTISTSTDIRFVSQVDVSIDFQHQHAYIQTEIKNGYNMIPVYYVSNENIIYYDGILD